MRRRWQTCVRRRRGFHWHGARERANKYIGLALVCAFVWVFVWLWVWLWVWVRVRVCM